MGLLIFNFFILIMFYLNFSLNEEVLLFFTFSIFFFIFVKTISGATLSFLNNNRYKIFYKFIKIVNILVLSLNNIKWIYYLTSLFDFVLESFILLPIHINDRFRK